MPSTVDTVDTIVIGSLMFCRELGDGHQKGHSKLPKLGNITLNSCSVATWYPKIFVTPPARLPPYRLVQYSCRSIDRTKSGVWAPVKGAGGSKLIHQGGAGQPGNRMSAHPSIAARRGTPRLRIESSRLPVVVTGETH
ncbi:hypothetical protein FB451DRAFT_1176710 [Mycena latifolia]|nr:hypothetical protein FB451DRAFT_1176710 [Mycena latifolia]